MTVSLFNHDPLFQGLNFRCPGARPPLADPTNPVPCMDGMVLRDQ